MYVLITGLKVHQVSLDRRPGHRCKLRIKVGGLMASVECEPIGGGGLGRTLGQGRGGKTPLKLKKKWKLGTNLCIFVNMQPS